MSSAKIALIVIGAVVVVFVGCVVMLGVGFAILGRESPPRAARPKWKVGETTQVEITLVSGDRADVACASTAEVAGKHCAFEAPGKAWSRGSSADDKTLLRPYTTVDQVNLTAAGLWSEPALAPDKLPTKRFTVKCTYEVEGTLDKLGVRWRDGEQFFPNSEWYAGSVSDCKVAPP